MKLAGGAIMAAAAVAAQTLKHPSMASVHPTQVWWGGQIGTAHEKNLKWTGPPDTELKILRHRVKNTWFPDIGRSGCGDTPCRLTRMLHKFWSTRPRLGQLDTAPATAPALTPARHGGAHPAPLSPPVSPQQATLPTVTPPLAALPHVSPPMAALPLVAPPLAARHMSPPN